MRRAKATIPNNTKWHNDQVPSLNIDIPSDDDENITKNPNIKVKYGYRIITAKLFPIQYRCCRKTDYSDNEVSWCYQHRHCHRRQHIRCISSNGAENEYAFHKLIFFIIVLLATATLLIIAAGLIVSKSDFILYNKISIYPAAVIPFIRRYFGISCGDGKKNTVFNYHWYNVALQQTPVDLSPFDCSFDLCHVAHEGGEGVLYNGICQSKTSKVNVLLKLLKQFQMATHESQAAGIIGDVTEMKRLATGANFLIMSQIDDYRKLRLPPNIDHLHLPAFVAVMIKDVMFQLKSLHRRGYFHLDMWLNNILYRRIKNNDFIPDNNTTVHKNGTTHARQWMFQLIDFSSSRPIKDNRSTSNIISKCFKDKRHIPKMPVLACLSSVTTMMPKAANDYCRQTVTLSEYQNGEYIGNNNYNVSANAPCLGYIDAYPLGIQALRILMFHHRNRTNILPKDFDFNDVVKSHEMYISLLGRARRIYGAHLEVIELISQLIDFRSLNSSLVC